MLLEYFYFITIFLFGLIIGSFLNVCIYRLPRSRCKSCGNIITPADLLEISSAVMSFGRVCPKCSSKDGLRRLSLISPGSHCIACNKSIPWYQNIPVFSYLFLRGRCARCGTPISLRYPLIELLTALLFVFSAYHYLYPPLQAGVCPLGTLWVSAPADALVWFIISLYLISALLIATFVDIEFRIIPDEISIPGVCLSLLASALFPFIHSPTISFLPDFLHQAGLPYPVLGLISGLVGILAGGGIIYLVGVVGKLVFRRPAMGFGDVKLMAFLGGFLGPESILYIFLLACFLGSIIGIVLYIARKQRYIAFGPYLSLAALIVLFFKPEVTHLIFTAYPEFIRGLIG